MTMNPHRCKPDVPAHVSWPLLPLGTVLVVRNVPVYIPDIPNSLNPSCLLIMSPCGNLHITYFTYNPGLQWSE